TEGWLLTYLDLITLLLVMFVVMLAFSRFGAPRTEQASADRPAAVAIVSDASADKANASMAGEPLPPQPAEANEPVSPEAPRDTGEVTVQPSPVASIDSDSRLPQAHSEAPATPFVEQTDSGLLASDALQDEATGRPADDFHARP